MKRLKKITAGSLVREVVYTVPSRSDTPVTRQKRQRISSEAQARLNIETSKDKLEMVTHANFRAGDLWITLTYDDEHLPPDRKSATAELRHFIGLLRQVRRKRGDSLSYVYCTQSVLDDGSHRLHHHMICNATDFRQDVEDISSLWRAGPNVDVRQMDWDDLSDKAAYMCHEPMQYGKMKVGERMWTPSKGLLRPTEETYDVPDDLTLEAPQGATILENDTKRTEYGMYAFLKYRMPAKNISGGVLTNGCTTEKRTGTPDSSRALWYNSNRKSVMA